MQNSTIVFLINEDARAVNAQYEKDGSSTTFKTLDATIKVDDFVVVESGTRHGMTVAKVTAVDIDIDFEAAKNIQWIVQKINSPEFNKILELERQAIATVQNPERRRKRDELRKNLFADQQDQIKALGLAKTSEVTE